MDSTKAWYASKTIWASILQMGVGIAVATGLVNDVAGSTIVTDGPDLIIGIVNIALAGYAMYGRVKADKAIA